jgi:peptide/nickel transport system permease protein
VPLAEGGFWEWFSHLIMPGIALSLGPAAIIARQMRSALIDVMGATYIRTAWAKGVSTYRVVFHHALKNAASAPLTVFGVILTSLLGGTVIIETLFGIDGSGLLIVNAVRSSDVPMLQGIVLMFVVATMAINLVIDIIYGYLNPKVRIT